MSATPTINQFVDSIPPVSELRERLSENLRERALLRRLMKLSQDKTRLDGTQGSMSPVDRTSSRRRWSYLF